MSMSDKGVPGYRDAVSAGSSRHEQTSASSALAPWELSSILSYYCGDREGNGAIDDDDADSWSNIPSISDDEEMSSVGSATTVSVESKSTKWEREQEILLTYYTRNEELGLSPHLTQGESIPFAQEVSLETRLRQALRAEKHRSEQLTHVLKQHLQDLDTLAVKEKERRTVHAFRMVSRAQHTILCTVFAALVQQTLEAKQQAVAGERLIQTIVHRMSESACIVICRKILLSWASEMQMRAWKLWDRSTRRTRTLRRVLAHVSKSALVRAWKTWNMIVELRAHARSTAAGMRQQRCSMWMLLIQRHSSRCLDASIRHWHDWSLAQTHVRRFDLGVLARRRCEALYAALQAWMEHVRTNKMLVYSTTKFMARQIKTTCAAAFCTWIEHAAEQRSACRVLARAMRKQAAGTREVVASMLSRWMQHCVCSRRRRRAARKVMGTCNLRRLMAAWDRWRGLQAKCSLLRMTARIQARSVLLMRAAFSTWHQHAGDGARARCMLRAVTVARHLRRSTAVFQAWVHLARARKASAQRLRAIAGKVGVRLRGRCSQGAFAAWHNSIRDSMQLRCMSAKAVAGWDRRVQRRLLRLWLAWRSESDRLQRTSGKICPRWTRVCLNSIWDKWVLWCYERQRVYIASKAGLCRRVSACFWVWHGDVDWRKWLRSRMHKVLVRDQHKKNRVGMAAVSAWRAHARNQSEDRARTWGVMTRKAQEMALGQWAEGMRRERAARVEERRASKALLCIRKWMVSSIARRFVAWLGSTHLGRRRRHVLSKAATRRHQRVQAIALQRWTWLRACSMRLRHAARRVKTRMARKALTAWWDRWMQWRRELRRRGRSVRRVAARLWGSSLRAVVALWRENAEERKRLHWRTSKALRVRSSRALVLSFAAWRGAARELRRGSWIKHKITARWRLHASSCAFLWWLDSVHFRCRLAEFVHHQDTLSLVRALEGWHDRARMCQRQALVLARASKHMQQYRIQDAASAWRLVGTEHRRRGAQVSIKLALLAHRTQRAALMSWWERASNDKQRGTRLRKAVERWRQSSVLQHFGVWLRRAGAAAKSRKIARRGQVRCVGAAWCKWWGCVCLSEEAARVARLEAAHEHRLQGEKMAMCERASRAHLTRWVQGVVASSFGRWQQHLHTQKSQGQRVRRSISRQLRVRAGSVFALWRNIVDEIRSARACASKILGRGYIREARGTGRVAARRCFEVWCDLASGEAQRHMLTSFVLRRMEDRVVVVTLCIVVAMWKACTCQLIQRRRLTVLLCENVRSRVMRRMLVAPGFACWLRMTVRAKEHEWMATRLAECVIRHALRVGLADSFCGWQEHASKASVLPVNASPLKSPAADTLSSSQTSVVSPTKPSNGNTLEGFAWIRCELRELEGQLTRIHQEL